MDQLGLKNAMKLSVQSFIIHLSLVAMLVLGAQQTVFAQDGGLDQSFEDAANLATDAGLSETEPYAFIEQIIQVVLGLVGIIAAAILIWGGIMYITSAGDEQKAAHAKRIIIYAVVGLVFIGLSIVIVNLTINFFTP